MPELESRFRKRRRRPAGAGSPLKAPFSVIVRPVAVARRSRAHATSEHRSSTVAATGRADARSTATAQVRGALVVGSRRCSASPQDVADLLDARPTASPRLARLRDASHRAVAPTRLVEDRAARDSFAQADDHGQGVVAQCALGGRPAGFESHFQEPKRSVHRPLPRCNQDENRFHRAPPNPENPRKRSCRTTDA